MLAVMKRTTIVAVAVTAIALVPVVVLAAGGLGGKPTATHGPKRTPSPTVLVTPTPTAVNATTPFCRSVTFIELPQAG